MSHPTIELMEDNFMDWWDSLSPKQQLDEALNADMVRGVESEIGFNMRSGFTVQSANRIAYMDEIDQLLMR
jgi:hypothetical protein